MSFRYRRDNPSLHYFALQRSQEDYYVTLSYVPDSGGCKYLGIQRSDLFLDLLEMWCCLMFRTLAKKYLEEFLPEDIQLRKETHENLNLDLPLQGYSRNWNKIRDILVESTDSLFQGYYLDEAQKYHRNTPELVKHQELGLETCKKLDGIPILGSTHLRSTLLSPPTSATKPAERRLQLQTSKEIRPNTPVSMTSKTATNLPKDDMSLDSGVACIEASNVDKTEQENRKRKLHEETPSKSPRPRPAKKIRPDSASLTGRPVNRTLVFENVAEPKVYDTEAPWDDDSSDLDELSDAMGFWT
jgi:hypothetical protein